MSETKRSEIRRRNRPGGKVEPRKSERTRQSILDAALKFLWTHPFRDLTVGELMSLAGTSRSAFYRYFEDLHDLMEVLLRGMEEEILAVTSALVAMEKVTPLPLLEESIENLVLILLPTGAHFAGSF